MLRAKYYFLLALALLLLAGCKQEPVNQRILAVSAQLDQAYVPVLFYTKLNRQHESELAWDKFRGKWNDFNGQFRGLKLKYGVDIVDEFWEEDFAATETAVVSAEGLIKQKSLAAANAELLKVQQHLPELRRRHGIAYFPDTLSRFQRVMLMIKGAVDGKPRLTDRELAQLGEMLKMAQAEWTRAANQEIDPGYFKFPAKKIKALKKMVGDEERGLGSFAAALASKRADLIIAAVDELQPTFTQIYRSFGDFQPVFDQLAAERRATSSTTTTTLGKRKRRF